MTRRTFTAVAVVFLALAGRAAAAETKLTVKAEATPLPSELSEPIRALLEDKALNVSDEKGELLCTIWLRKALESKATADQVKAGLTYRELDETMVIGAVRLPKVWTDFRKQKIKPGVYTLRLGFQPMDGDHMGTAPFNEFCLLAPAKRDEKPGTMDVKAMHQMSGSASGGSHPSIMLLFPNPMPADAPSVESKPDNISVLNFKLPVNAAGQKAALGFSLVVVGHSAAE